MMRQKLSIGVVATAFTLSVAPVWAQDDRGRPQGEQGRPSSGETTGSAVPRGGGSDSGSSSSSSSSSGSSSSSSGPSSSGSSDSPTAWMGSGPTSERAPARPERVDRADRAEQRRGGGSSSGTTGRAVPRGESGTRSGGSVDSTTSSAGSESQPSQGRSRAVPTYSRPRDGRTPLGTAVERTSPTLDRNYRGGYYYDPYYSFYYDPYSSGRYSYWSPMGYGYGLGYFSYDPFLFSGYGYPGSYGGGYNDPYYGGGGGSGSYSARSGQGYRPAGALRLKVKPANAQVHIDGYYVGVIDSFDGAFQRLAVESGAHRVELRSEGYEPVQFDVMITPGDTITYKGEMKRQ